MNVWEISCKEALTDDLIKTWKEADGNLNNFIKLYKMFFTTLEQKKKKEVINPFECGNKTLLSLGITVLYA